MAPPASSGEACSSGAEALSSPLGVSPSPEELSTSLDGFPPWRRRRCPAVWPGASWGASPLGSSGGLPMSSLALGMAGAWPALSWVAADMPAPSTASWDCPMPPLPRALPAAPVVHGAHGGDVHRGGVHQGRAVLTLSLVGRGDGVLQLALDALGSQQAEVLQGLHPRLECPRQWPRTGKRCPRAPLWPPGTARCSKRPPCPRQHHVGGDRQNHQGGNHGQGHQRHPKAGEYITPAKVFL